jgi:hypothetical protein
MTQYTTDDGANTTQYTTDDGANTTQYTTDDGANDGVNVTNDVLSHKIGPIKVLYYCVFSCAVVCAVYFFNPRVLSIM